MQARHAVTVLGSAALLLCLAASAGGQQFASHVTVSTPARSYSHGVGDPIAVAHRRSGLRWNSYAGYTRPAAAFAGYPRERPARPFTSEDVFPGGHSLAPAPQYRGFQETPIPVLPPSPYKVDSPDPESLWPQGLFVPPTNQGNRYSHHFDPEVPSASDALDPYLVEGAVAIAAVARAREHGVYYFQDIPHIASLFANNELRIRNNLPPHRVGSIRHTWPFNRP